MRNSNLLIKAIPRLLLTSTIVVLLAANASAAEISVRIDTASRSVNLSSLGDTDWVHWGLGTESSETRKSGVARKISDFKPLPGRIRRFVGSPAQRATYSWRDGTPTRSADTTTGLYATGYGSGFEITVPADKSRRTLKIFTGGYQARGQVEVSLSDRSATPYVRSFEDMRNPFDRTVTINYSAASAGETLTVRISLMSGSNITLQAATLAGSSQDSSDDNNPPPQPDDPPADGGLLQGRLSTSPGYVDLSSQGGTDWRHWGLNSASDKMRKAGVNSRIGDFRTIARSARRYAGGNRTTVSWSGGTPIRSASTSAGVYFSGMGNGFEIRVPADRTRRTLKVFTGGYKAGARVEVSLSDRSAPSWAGTFEDLRNPYDRTITIDFNASKSGQTLTVRVSMVSGSRTAGANITLQAATLTSSGQDSSGGSDSPPDSDDPPPGEDESPPDTDDPPEADNPPPNTPPTIGGTPPTEINAGEEYSWRPTASDADGDPVTYSIENRPAWLSFNSGNGRLRGIPDNADVGRYDNIRVCVSDGTDRACTRRFSITVADIGVHSVTLSWTAPDRNEDGSGLTNLAGHEVYLGRSSGDYTEVINISNPSVTSTVLEGLSTGRYFVAVKAYNRNGVSSRFSQELQFTVR